MNDPLAGWMDAPDHPELVGNEVHTWGWHLEGRLDEIGRLKATLSEDELGRMRSFRFIADAERFVWARGGLRAILGRYVGVDARAIRMAYGDCGKPALADDQGGVHFNLSHTKRMAVAAFSVSGPVGIDVEERGTVSRTLGDPVFSPRELIELKGLSNGAYTNAFFHGWTRKEAVCKAEGLGFHLPVQAFSVSLLPSKTARVEDRGGVLSRDWHLVDLPLEGEVAGCLAVEAAAPTLRFYRAVRESGFPQDHPLHTAKVADDAATVTLPLLTTGVGPKRMPS